MLLVSSGRAADKRRPLPFDPQRFLNQPQKMFDALFGSAAAEQQKRLERIPVSAQEESRFGAQQVRGYQELLRRNRKPVASRGRDVDYLRKLIAVIRPFLRNGRRYRRLQVYVVDSDEISARTFPGGAIFVHRGMLEFAGSEAALVAILGHELSHLDRGHLLRDARKTKWLQQTYAAPAQGRSPDGPRAFQQMFTSGAALMRSMLQPFRPEQELEADQDGTRWAHRAGYDPQPFADLFARMERRRDRRPAAAPEFLRSHPLNPERRRRVEREIAALRRRRPAEPLYIGRRNLQLRIPRSERRFPDR